MNYIKSILYSNDELLTGNKNEKYVSSIEPHFKDNDDSNDSHNIPISLADKSIESLRILRGSGEITKSEEARRLKLLQSFLEYQRECDIEEEVERTSRSPFLLWLFFTDAMSFFCRCYKIDGKGMKDDLD